MKSLGALIKEAFAYRKMDSQGSLKFVGVPRSSTYKYPEGEIVIADDGWLFSLKPCEPF